MIDLIAIDTEGVVHRARLYQRQELARTLCQRLVSEDNGFVGSERALSPHATCLVCLLKEV